MSRPVGSPGGSAGGANAGFGRSQGESFSRFYLRNVAISEGCGCAEMVVRREQDGVRQEAGLRTILRLLWLRLTHGKAALRARENA